MTWTSSQPESRQEPLPLPSVSSGVWMPGSMRTRYFTACWIVWLRRTSRSTVPSSPGRIVARNASMKRASRGVSGSTSRKGVSSRAIASG